MRYVEGLIISNAIEILRKYPLCDRCLGRLFAKYGLGLNNVLRGRAIKTLVLMEIHRKICQDLSYIDMLKDLWPNVGVMPQLYSKYVGPVTLRHSCYICSDKLDIIIYKLLTDALSKLSMYKVRTFVVGVNSGSELEKREREVISEFQIDSWESIRREVKRELGKKIKALMGIEPDFKHPDVIISIDLDSLSVNVVSTPTYLLGRYIKLGRNISQLRWVLKSGVRKYPLSLEDVLDKIRSCVNAEQLKIHAAGREDVDVRMLGSGRQFIVELKNLKNKDLSIEQLNKCVQGSTWILIDFSEVVEPRYVRELKLKNVPKIYRILALSEKPLNNDIQSVIEREFTSREIMQRTPTRILRRKRDFLRVRKVYGVRVKVINEYIFEMLVKCDGGLYVKELVHGDFGRTKPSIAEVLDSRLRVLEVDVLRAY